MLGHALTKIQSIINQNLWFDVLSINQHLSKQQIQTCLNMLWNETRGYRLSAEAERDGAVRTTLMWEQRTENGRLVRQLLTKQAH
ncbi:hypothetical protein DCO44_15490 [Acinetobacter sp. AM]|nr:hypothetical protein DCO44_15490 [Acinetobacter sp. AM]